jgi:hypothetical protein
MRWEEEKEKKCNFKQKINFIFLFLFILFNKNQEIFAVSSNNKTTLQNKIQFKYIYFNEKMSQM